MPAGGDLSVFSVELEKYNLELQRVLEDYTRVLGSHIAEQPMWDDFRVPFTRDKQGQTSLPDFDFVNLGLLFPQNDAAEIVYLINQMPHSWKIGSPIIPHVHYIQTGSTFPVFKMDYKLYDNGGTVPSTWTTISTEASGEFDYSSGSMLQMLNFPEINMSSISGTSAFLDVKFYRDDNVVTGDIITKEWDFHYQLDSFGSRKEIKK